MPPNIPGSFLYKSKDGDKISIKYSIECYIDGMKETMRDKKDFIVREFLFTDKELEEDQVKYDKIASLRQILKPMTVRITSEVEMKAKKFSIKQRQLSLGLTNNSWDLEQKVIGNRCLCFRGNY